VAANPDSPIREPLDFRRLFAGLLLLVLALLFFGMIAPFLEALVLAAIFSAMLYPVYAWLRRHFHRDGIAALVTTLGGLVIVAVPLTLLVGAVSREALRLSENGPLVEETTGATIVDTLPSWLPFAEELKPHRAAIIERTQAIVEQIETFVVDTLSRATQGTLAFLLSLFVLLYAMIYFLSHGPALLKLVSEHLPLAYKHQREIAQRGVAVTRATLQSVLIIGAVQGVLGGIALGMAGIEGAVFWGLVIAVASTLPVVGTALVLGPATLVLLIRGDTGAALGLGAFSLIVVGGIDNLLRPYLVGHSARLPDLLVLVSTLGGLAMFGATGIIVGPVLAGVFLTSLHIFIATFKSELEAASASPVVIVGCTRDARTETQHAAQRTVGQEGDEPQASHRPWSLASATGRRQGPEHTEAKA
jgi:predicted PurR-regulated permease PerM